MGTKRLSAVTVAFAMILSAMVAGVAVGAPAPERDAAIGAGGGPDGGPNGDGATVRVAIYATGAEKADLQREHGVRHDFGDVFTTDVSERAYERLQARGTTVERVGVAYPVHHREGHSGGPGGGSTDSGISVSWSAPSDGATVAGTVTLQISASDSDGAIAKVEWALDGATQGEATDADGDGVYEASWDTTSASEGGHDLTATATDDASNTKSATITVTVDNVEDSTTARVADQTPYGIEQIYADPAVASTSGGAGVDVAVLDTGVDTDHVDLVNRIHGCVDFTGGGPFGTNIQEGSCEDKSGHGTHVAGTVLADGGSDGLGVYGVAPEARLHAYKVCGGSGCYYDDIAAAIDYAGDHGVEVVSMSLGGDSGSSLLRDALGRNAGVLFVAAAGNDGPDLETIDYPGRYAEVVAVAAVDADYRVADFSSRGVDDTSFQEKNKYIEVSAAGVKVLSTYNDGGYRELSGTSMATPHVSGFAAKTWASGAADAHGNGDGTTTATEVRAYVQYRASFTDVTTGTHATAGYDPASGIGLPTVE